MVSIMHLESAPVMDLDSYMRIFNLDLAATVMRFVIFLFHLAQRDL